ncbi:MAG: hypothetical protein KF901_22495 [Myxococcales bacterium]|nr:hypothetical protein [Myxococcales bacterium]
MAEAGPFDPGDHVQKRLRDPVDVGLARTSRRDVGRAVGSCPHRLEVVHSLTWELTSAGEILEQILERHSARLRPCALRDPVHRGLERTPGVKEERIRITPEAVARALLQQLDEPPLIVLDTQRSIRI